MGTWCADGLPQPLCASQQRSGRHLWPQHHRTHVSEERQPPDSLHPQQRPRVRPALQAGRRPGARPGHGCFSEPERKKADDGVGLLPKPEYKQDDALKVLSMPEWKQADWVPWELRSMPKREEADAVGLLPESEGQADAIDCPSCISKRARMHQTKGEREGPTGHYNPARVRCLL